MKRLKSVNYRGSRNPNHLLMSKKLLAFYHYKEESDELANFSCRYREVPNERLKADSFFSEYLNWCQETNRRPLTRTTFGSRMAQKFTKKHFRDGWYYEGVCLESEAMPVKHL